MADEGVEVLVIGGGPAGLSAALYLARYDRSVALFDTGHGRSTWHQVNHNYLGFPGGIATRALRQLGYAQLAEYPHVRVIEHKVLEVQRRADHFVACGQSGEWPGRAVVLCTGVLDHYPHFPGWQEYVGRSLFWCITCDGYGSRGKRVVMLGNTNTAALEALQLARFTTHLTMLTDSHEQRIDETMRERLEVAGIPILHDRLETVSGVDGQIQALTTQGGQRLEADRLFSQQGATPQNALALGLGLAISDQGYILVDTEQRTSMDGVFAAGDGTRLHSHQVTTAVHEGGQAASAANFYLYPPELQRA